MGFPEEFIKRAREEEHFTLHSGRKSRILYDINSMLMDDAWLRRIIDSVPTSHHYVGIVSGGAIIARVVSWARGANCSMIKDGELKGNGPEGR